jgi:putative transposase
MRIIWASHSRGRKPLDLKLRTLIIEMKSLNPRWGAQRISDELKKIGMFVSKPTILKVLREEGLIFHPPHRRLKWSEFLKNHNFIIGIDFTTVFDLFARQYFILVLLDLKTRELILINATLHPTREWLTQQFRNAFMDREKYPDICIADNDGIYGNWLTQMLVNYYGTRLVHTPYRRPQYNGPVERFHRSLKNEAFATNIPLSLSQIQKTCWRYQQYYNQDRCHQGLEGQTPDNIQIQSSQIQGFRKRSHLNGAITAFVPKYLQAA